ncbi:MAG: isoaspartyl peptidase/L-asparaginase [Erysipelotrichaceae bacterium]|nr:isoaspartyl peptidase/L-asparaginase [Erysipelotrichaceae bacterium]
MKWAIIGTWKMSYQGILKASQQLEQNLSASDAVLTAIHDVEENPNFHSVGYSGLPNKEGIITCDAGYMDGTTLQVGAVGALEHVIHAIDVAKKCSETRFNNVLVGQGANIFAQKNGFANENLMSEETYQYYLKQLQNPKPLAAYNGHDTVGVLACDQKKHLIAATSTSGLFMKEPGRIGDSPLVGCGFYADDTIGCACATGVGEEIMRGCLSYDVIIRMKQGQDPQTAASQCVAEFSKRMIKQKGYVDAISLICMNQEGEIGVGTNVKFAFTYANDQHMPTIYIAEPKENGTSVRAITDSDIDID